MPHLAHGMHRRLEVTGPAGGGPSGTPASTQASTPGGAPIPTAGTITLQDFGILLPDGFAGKGWYQVVNDGPQPHEAVIYKAAPGHTSAELSTYLTRIGAALSGTGPMPTDPFPGVPAGGVSAAAKGPTSGSGSTSTRAASTCSCAASPTRPRASSPTSWRG